MAHWTGKDMGLKLDNESGTLTDLGPHVNSQDLARVVAMLEDTGMGESESTFLPGMGSNTVALNGMVDSTVAEILNPLVTTNTSLLKTLQFQEKSDVFIYGEGWLDQINVSGTPQTLETFSANFTFSGALTKTSVTQS